MSRQHPLQPRKNSLRFETLEERMPLAGNVIVRIRNDDLIIRGDGASNDVYLRSTGFIDEFEIVGGYWAGGQTLINGKNAPFVFDNFDFSDDVRVNMKGGRDRIRIHGANSGDGDFDVWNDLTINMAGGRDRVELRYVQVGSYGEPDSDTLVNLGKGANNFYASYVDVDDDLRVFTANKQQSLSKKTRLDMYNMTIGDQLDVDLYWCIGVVNIYNSDSDDLLIDLYSGNDKVSIRNSSARLSDLDGGADTDSLNLYMNSSSFNYTSFLPPTSSNIIYD